MLRDHLKNTLRANRIKALKAIPKRTTVEQIELEAYEAQIAAEFSNSVSQVRDKIRAKTVFGKRPRYRLGQLGKRYSTTHNKGSSPSVFKVKLPDGKVVDKSTYRIHTEDAIGVIFFDKTLRRWIVHSLCERSDIPAWLVDGIARGKYRIVETKRTRWGHP